ncbi:DUF2752 domain-containing protein [Candidatus Mycobacterium wuenschmannii]|uniref:DUF2752 domain-containing protein n=1 Tax=Candidatus Mycobacterium wuenschmannii TaxID=3027808 RepID=A0ABY8VZ83_9MYCO|nr:DUF2752 domain-containing protein [Candidatus Mycobacterium wuenschmannii]WIM88802.1 DUF2752 domain-containing protein [Candidatus Mycobacterium wuenschmannii]
MSGPATHGSHHPTARWVWGLGAVAVVGALAYVGLVDPHNPGAIFPICPFRLLTGLNCPGCGTLRMVHDVLHGDVAAAVNDNVVLLVGLPLLAGWIVLRRRRGQWPLTLPAAVTVLVTLATWTVVRNLPGFPLVPTLLTH